jgi:general secretion pathway protein N
LKRRRDLPGIVSGAFGRARSRSAATDDEQAWRRDRRSTVRWSVWGAVCGLLVGLVIFAPAAWLASAVNAATAERLLMLDARGSVWTGNAVLSLAGGAGSRDASALPGRLFWRLRPGWTGLRLQLSQVCCLSGGWEIALGLSKVEMLRNAPAGAGSADSGDRVGHWPASLLAGLGAPWNSLHLDGSLNLASKGLALRRDQGRWRLVGGAELDLLSASATVSPLPVLGSWRLIVRGDDQGSAGLSLSTLAGPLQLQGSGHWRGDAVHFRGEAQAAPGQEAVLSNLLNIVGRRQGARSIIAIG